MAEWCMEHPWMTFIIALTLAQGVGNFIRIKIVHRRKSTTE
jgi:hypothetical protein